MLNENQTDPRKDFTVRFLPWILGAAMLVVYLFTLNHWVTLLNVGQVATASGWVWQPQTTNPLLFLAMLPFRLLPAAEIPLALNLFSAVCAALALVLLARSVALLPHDRTDAERQRERSDFSFLSGRFAIFPPLLAVVLVGLQLTFWEHATSFTGESFELLLFAFIIWQLLEYRLDENPGRLFLVAFAYGAGFAENWAFIGFFPLFLTAIIWLRQREFFNLNFLARMFWCGVAGIILFLLFLPVVMKISGRFPYNFWYALQPGLQSDWAVIKAIANGQIWHQLGLLSLATFLPLLLMSIRWRASFGDSSRTGTMLMGYLFYLVNAVFFTACVWVMFDPPFSARQQSVSPALTLYYLSALGIGYYCGYFLIVFGKKAVPSRRNDFRPTPVLPKNLLWLCPVILAGTFVAAAFAIGLLIYKNAPAIHAINDNTLLKYAQFATQNLPPDGAILLSDNEGSKPGQPAAPVRTFVIQAMLAREGLTQKFPVVDTDALNWAPYHRFLHKRFPNQWPLVVKDKDLGAVNPLGNFAMLNLLAKSNNICYLNPSFGYYFESFYQVPQGLIYTMKSLPTNTLLPPPLEKNLISENENFWSHVTESVSPAITRALMPPDPDRRKNLGDWLLQHLHAAREPNPNALFAGMIYSRSLDFWGVQLQRAGELEKAANNFIAATNLNPDNTTAAINLDFNRKLRAGVTPKIDLGSVTPDKFGKARTWNEALAANGPFDEISFCYAYGNIVERDNGFFRQAIASFDRVRQLAPDNLDARLQLAQLYIFNHLPDRALEALHDPLTQPARFALTDENSTGLNILAAAAYFQNKDNARGSEALETEIARHPDDNKLLTAATQAYFQHGLYTNALRIIERKLAQTPNDTQWLFGKGYAELQTGNYDQAIATLTHVLDQTNNPTALFNRALAYLDAKKLDSARADYAKLQTTYTNSFQIAYGLGEIAWQQHQTNEAIHNYQIYLANAPTNTAEATNILERLRELKK